MLNILKSTTNQNHADLFLDRYLDTEEMSEAQLMWLDEEIGKSRARWKVVYGHFHIYSATRGDNETMIAKLLPLLKNRVDLYLCGHDHNLQHLKPESGLHFVVAGGGGASTYKTNLTRAPSSNTKITVSPFSKRRRTL
jgi:phosphodiesterase/alkaline phosphatase D-like protein